MKKTTIGGEPVFLMYFSPNWESPVECTFSIMSDTERGLTGKEDRKPLSLSLRTSLKFSILTHRESAAEFRNALKDLGNSPVLCPFWPALDRYAGSTKAGIVSGLWLVYEPDMSAWEIYANGSAPAVLVPSAKAKKVPLLWGRFDKAPQPEAVTDEVVPCDIVFTENSPVTMALTVDAQTFSDGPVSINMFPLLPNWVEQVKAGEAAYSLTKDDIGFGRVTADVYYDQNGSRRIEQAVTCAGWAAIKKLFRFFYDKSGTVGTFWLPMGLAGCRLVSEAQALDTIIEVDNAEGLGDDSHLALIQGKQAAGFTIEDVVDNSITLLEPLDRIYRPRQTVVSPLVLSRFESDTFEVSFITDELAVAEVRCIEVPEEYVLDEQAPSGPQTTKAFLYKFSLTGFADWLFTSFERPITDGTFTYVPKPFEHSDITETINLERNEIDLTSRRFSGSTYLENNPLGLFLPLRLESILYLEVLECSPDADGFISSEPTKIFKGQVASAKFDGPKILAKCVDISTPFDRKIPNVLMQPTCNYAPFSQPCGLLASDWKMTAQVVSYTAGAYTLIVTPPVFSNSTPEQTRPTISLFDHFFAGGKMEIGSGQTRERRGILDYANNGETRILTLRHPLETDPQASTVLYIWPGCDGKKETCKAFNSTSNPVGKFDNYARFGGFPFIPIGNPSVSKVNKDYSKGGKK